MMKGATNARVVKRIDAQGMQGMSSPGRRHGCATALLRLLSVIALVAVAATLYINVNFSNIPGTGRVLDVRHNQPVADVKLEGKCWRPNLIHGSHLLKTLTTQSDAQGRYRFSFFETWHCSDFALYPSKPGYVDLMAAQIPNQIVEFGSGVPGAVWVVKAEDVVPLRLDGLFAETGGTMTYGDGSGRRAYLTEFEWTLQRFVEAEKIARGDAQRAWIRQHFCPRLSQQFAAIPLAEREPSPAVALQFNAQVAQWRATCA